MLCVIALGVRHFVCCFVQRVCHCGPVVMFVCVIALGVCHVLCVIVLGVCYCVATLRRACPSIRQHRLIPRSKASGCTYYCCWRCALIDLLDCS